jgi:hypothetical protein
MMMLANKKMKIYLDQMTSVKPPDFDNFKFLKLAEGYFFKNEVNENVKLVAEIYKSDSSSDWAGFEYGANKIHLEDLIEGSIQEVAVTGISLVKQLSNDFKSQFKNAHPIFWLGIDEFSEFPSVTLGFYVKRKGMAPILPEDEASLEGFSNAISIVI